ncbi:unnamed protein product [Owenia fusiformis]|uniref:SMP-30/Gluconolactonase/LRE-like region domain-containing protein n=1 Tax=Owenia fusiformis TaxID=6347 RepID=A0A8S4Q829_OWEFU|nr:unnamed protein product [Owenia fusiformis]
MPVSNTGESLKPYTLLWHTKQKVTLVKEDAELVGGCIGDTIDLSCWKNCSVAISGSTAEKVLAGCIQKCRVGETCQTASNKTSFLKILKEKEVTEGPVFSKDGNFYLVLYVAGKIRKIDLENKNASTLVSPSLDGFQGMPLGLQCDRENNIWVADGRLGLLKVYQNGSFQQVATVNNKNEILQGFNDLMFDYHGNLWITAPHGPIAPFNFTRSNEEPFGSVYCYNNTTDEMIKAATGFLYPNGIAVQHDTNGVPMKIIFGTSHNVTSPLWSFDIVGPCQIENKQLWGNLPANSYIDGMDFDKEGNLIVTDYVSSTLFVYGPDGGPPICQLKLPFKHVTNINFRPDSNELYITAKSLWMLRWNSNGMERYCDRL